MGLVPDVRHFQPGSVDTSTKGPSGDASWEPVFHAGSTAQLPNRLTSAKEAPESPERPHLLETQRGRPRRHSPPRPRGANAGPATDERVRRLPAGYSEPAPGGRGRSPSCSETPQRAQGRPRQLRLQQEDAAHRESARKPAYAEPRHSAMETEAWKRRRTPPGPARASSEGSARADRRLARHVTPARRGPSAGRGAAERWRGAETPLPCRILALGGARGFECLRRLDKGHNACPGAVPFPELHPYPKNRGKDPFVFLVG